MVKNYKPPDALGRRLRASWPQDQSGHLKEPPTNVKKPTKRARKRKAPSSPGSDLTDSMSMTPMDLLGRGFNGPEEVIHTVTPYGRSRTDPVALAASPLQGPHEPEESEDDIPVAQLSSGRGISSSVESEAMLPLTPNVSDRERYSEEEWGEEKRGMTDERGDGEARDRKGSSVPRSAFNNSPSSSRPEDGELTPELYSQGSASPVFKVLSPPRACTSPPVDSPSPSSQLLSPLFGSVLSPAEDPISWMNALGLQARKRDPNTSALKSPAPNSSPLKTPTPASSPDTPTSKTSSLKTLASNTSSHKKLTPNTSSHKKLTPNTSSLKTPSANTSELKTLTPSSSSLKKPTHETSSHKTPTSSTSSLHTLTSTISSYKETTPNISSLKTPVSNIGSLKTPASNTSSHKKLTSKTSSLKTPARIPGGILVKPTPSLAAVPNARIGPDHSSPSASVTPIPSPTKKPASLMSSVPSFSRSRTPLGSPLGSTLLSPARTFSPQGTSVTRHQKSVKRKVHSLGF